MSFFPEGLESFKEKPGSSHFGRVDTTYCRQGTFFLNDRHPVRVYGSSWGEGMNENTREKKTVVGPNHKESCFCSLWSRAILSKDAGASIR